MTELENDWVKTLDELIKSRNLRSPCYRNNGCFSVDTYFGVFESKKSKQSCAKTACEYIQGMFYDGNPFTVPVIYETENEPSEQVVIQHHEHHGASVLAHIVTQDQILTVIYVFNDEEYISQWIHEDGAWDFLR
jgi:hypothetical protein